MKYSDNPKFMPVAFGINGQRQTLQSDSVTGTSLASYNAGFPPITMINKDAGGIPPQGKDFNQILFELSSSAQWSQASGLFPYNADFATSIGGYPMGALVVSAGGSSIYQSTTDNNTNALTGDGWVKISTQADYGVILPDTVAIFDVTTNYASFKSRGFYSADDGGGAVWVSTGNTVTASAGTHDISSAKVYNANGYEYELSINFATEISPVCNGLKAILPADFIADTEDFTCVGQCVNGILSLVPDMIYASNGDFTIPIKTNIKIKFPTNVYRIGKEPVKPISNSDINFGKSNFSCFASPSNKYSITGVKLDAIRYGYDEIKAKWEKFTDDRSWGNMSLQNVTLSHGSFWGDHMITKTADECSSGVGCLVLNPEYVHRENMWFEDFTWCGVDFKAEVEATVWSQTNNIDDNTKDFKYICDFMGSSRVGNFYGATWLNCRLNGGRRGTFRSNVDWSWMKGGTCTNNLQWGSSSNVSGENMDYIAAITGAGWTTDGCYLSANGGLSDYTNPSKGVCYTSAKGHVYSGIYTEHCYCNFVISAWDFTNGDPMRGMGLQILGSTTYKADDWNKFMMVRFESDSFGGYGSDGVWVYPKFFTETTTPQGVGMWGIGSPVRDYGAFPDGGFDFKYGTYNIGIDSGKLPDFDSLRNTKTANEMLTPYGLQVNSTNSGNLYLPLKNPSLKSVICVWIKDLTGNFDSKNISMYLTAQLEGQQTNSNDYLANGELMIDYGNGYKLITLANRMFTANNGVSTYAPQKNLTITVPSDTPIIMKAVEAYTGGIPFWPTGTNYEPKSDAKSIWSQGLFGGELNGLGGGMFLEGDIVYPWVGVARNSDNYEFLPSIFGTATSTTRIVESGMNVESTMRANFTATVSSVDSTNGTTTISIPDSDIYYIAMGIPLNVTATSNTSTSETSPVGNQTLIKRVMNSDGTSTNSYVVRGAFGASGDSWTIDQNGLSDYSFM